MIILDDTNLPDCGGGLEIARRVGRREISHVVHDVDGTHSLIRDWMPVMSVLLHYAMTSGLPEGFDSDENRRRLAAQVAGAPLPETDRFCVESAGMSALTQMEWAIRRGVENGAVRVPGGPLSPEERAANSEVVRRMWEGEERFPDLEASPRLAGYVEERAPRLFHFYEEVLNDAGRDRNLARAREDPGAWRVPGSLEFLERLRAGGAKNYFVTGAVISAERPARGMLEEIETIGFEVGPGKLVEAIRGSSWDKKIPKSELIAELLKEVAADGRSVLVVGDGRSEVRAGVEIGAVVMSRLPAEAARQRQLHRELGANYIVPDYTGPALAELLRG